MTPMGIRVRMTDRQTCHIGMGSFFIVNNYSKFEVNIFSKDRDIKKKVDFE